MKTTSNTILKNTSPDYSIIFEDKIINEPNDMTRVLYQNTGSFEILSDSHKFEGMCGAIYDNELDIGCPVEINTNWKHKSTILKIS